MKILVLMLMAAVMVGCRTTLNETPQGPIEYRQGFAEGCDAGKNAAGLDYYEYRKDPARFDQDSLYAQGWVDGYHRCFARIAG